MKISKIAVLPMNMDHPQFQQSINSMISELFMEGWEFDKIVLGGRKTLVVFSKQKENKIPEEKKNEN